MTPLKIMYTNYRGETSERNIIPSMVWFGATDWHPVPQWLVTAWDMDKNATRDFALADFGHPADAIARLTAPVSFAETDAAIGILTVEQREDCKWLTEPLHLARLVKHIIDARSAATALPAREPVAVRYGFDGYGWSYFDEGNGSDWFERAMQYPDAEPVYAAEDKT